MILASAAFGYERLSDGILVNLRDYSVPSGGMLKIQVCTDEIIHITATPGPSFSSHKSLMAEKETWPPVQFSLSERNGNVELSTSRITVKLDPQGRLGFYGSNGKPILLEKSSGNRTFTPATVMGEQTFHIQQLFESEPTEAFYGLGQHQNDVMNYKGHDVDLWQYNCEAVVPFLVSSKQYGILWDNNSRTKFGDIRDFRSLTELTCTNGRGQSGGLTAEYFSDAAMEHPFASRTESKIEHEFEDVNDPFPDHFKERVKAVRWSGEIASNQTGLHKFRLYCSGYTKMWIDGKLVVDNWRQNWLPWTHYPVLRMEAGKRYSIKIEWIHLGGYIGLKCLKPSTMDDEKTFSLYSDVADQIDYYFIHGGNLDDVIGGYRQITGKASLMPKWALGFWQCRERYKTQKELTDVVREFRKRQIPIDNIVQDWFYWPEDQWGSHDFDKTRYPNPDQMIKTLHDELNTHLMISVWPKFYVGIQNYEAVKNKGWLYMRNVEKGQKDWVGPGYVSTFYDPYSAPARDLFWDQINKKLFSKGIDAWWLDATEPDIQSNLSREETLLRNGPTALGTAARYLNTFSLMNSKGIYEKQRETNPDQRVFILTRSAFAGQQRYSAVTWSGDIAARWYDLDAQISAGLNFCLSGIPYWTTDIGGFAVEPRYENNVSDEDLDEWRELNTRWFQYGTFCPIFRVHGQYPYREMFNIAPDHHPAYQTMLAYDKLRYRLMPYIYSLAGMVTHQDYTIMRALIMDFNHDPLVDSIGNQFMFGPALLINPVTVYKARSREVYLPSGQGWYDLKSGKCIEGGQTITANAPYTDIPIFVKEGSIIPCGPDIQFTAEKPDDPIRLFIYTGLDGSFDLYEDEGINYHYEKGMYSWIPISYEEKTSRVTIGEREGEFPGMLKNRLFEIILIRKGKPRGLDFYANPDAVIPYSGAEVSLVIPVVKIK